MARINRDDIDKFYEYGVHVPTRTIYLGAESDGDGDEAGVEHAMAANAVKGLHLLDAASHAPITVVLNTSGGDEASGLAIYDAITACRSPVTVRGTGSVMSMGAWILQAGDVRELTPNATVMLHYGTFSADAHAEDFQRWARQAKRWDVAMEACFLTRIRARHPRYTLAKLKALLQFDTILTAEEAVDMGLADSVTVPPLPAQT